MLTNSIAQNETWRDVVGFEGYYQVSDLGQVRRIAKGSGSKPNTIRKPSIKNGLYYVMLSRNSNVTPYYIHYLVIRAFVGDKPSEYYEVKHLNGDKFDNRLSNLQWERRVGMNYDIPINIPDGYKFCPKCGKLKLANDEYFKPFARSDDNLTGTCRQCIQQTSKDRLKKAPHVKKAQRARRSSRKLSLPTEFTKEDWSRAIEYWGGCCAICGKQTTNLHADHWWPLTRPECTGSIPTNILPLCGGIRGCNNQKYNHNPEEWILRKLGEQQGRLQLEKIMRYFEWVKGE